MLQEAEHDLRPFCASATIYTSVTRNSGTQLDFLQFYICKTIPLVPLLYTRKKKLSKRISSGCGKTPSFDWDLFIFSLFIAVWQESIHMLRKHYCALGPTLAASMIYMCIFNSTPKSMQSAALFLKMGKWL